MVSFDKAFHFSQWPIIGPKLSRNWPTFSGPCFKTPFFDFCPPGPQQCHTYLGARPQDLIFGQVLRELVYAAIEVFAKSIQIVRHSAVARVIGDLGQRHPVDPRFIGDLGHCDDPSLPELLFGDQFLESESDHDLTRNVKLISAKKYYRLILTLRILMIKYIYRRMFLYSSVFLIQQGDDL